MINISPEIQGALIGGGIIILVWVLTHFLYEKKRLHHAKLINLFSIVQVERSLGDIETNAFRFHGIEEQDISNAGLTRQELAYLVASFTAGRIYDVGVYSESDMKEPYDETNYRYKMLAQPDTRKAWPLIVKMMTANEYIEKLEITMNAIDNGAVIGRRTKIKLCWPFKKVYIS